MNRRLFLLAGLTLLSGCATVGRPSEVAAAAAPLEELEPLGGFSISPEGLTIRVPSTGCTRKADFSFYAERGGGATRLAFARKPVRLCRSGAPGISILSFSWRELGLPAGGRVVLLNPVG